MPAARKTAPAAPPPVRPATAAERRRDEQWLLEITSLPTAAGREDRVVGWIKRWVEARRSWLTLEEDRWGNLVIRSRRKPKQGVAPLWITAHLDHPAFVVRKVDGRELELEFRGGVNDPYFVGAKLEVFDAKTARSVEATIRTLDAKATPFKLVTARLAKPLAGVGPGSIARWKFPKAAIRKGPSATKGDRLLHTHACDDLAALAAAIAAMERFGKDPSLAHVGLLFTRAEEIGFIGTIGAARSGTIPKGTRLVCLENSRSFAESPIGGGPIVRVGDRISVFTPELTNRIGAIMLEYQKEAPGYRFQRKLMPGGACEATAFASFGHASTCLCLPLGNYHNMVDIDGVAAGSAKAKVGPEFISVSDFHGLVTMLEVTARRLDDATIGSTAALMEKLWNERGFVVGGPGGPR
jgi:endoglucanase